MLSISILDFVCLLSFVWISLFIFLIICEFYCCAFGQSKLGYSHFPSPPSLIEKIKKKSEFSVSTFLFLILVSTSFWCCLSDTNSVKVLRKSNSKPILFNELQSDVSHFLYQCVFTFLLFLVVFSLFVAWIVWTQVERKEKRIRQFTHFTVLHKRHQVKYIFTKQIELLWKLSMTKHVTSWFQCGFAENVRWMCAGKESDILQWPNPNWVYFIITQHYRFVWHFDCFDGRKEWRKAKRIWIVYDSSWWLTLNFPDGS